MLYFFARQSKILMARSQPCRSNPTFNLENKDDRYAAYHTRKNRLPLGLLIEANMCWYIGCIPWDLTRMIPRSVSSPIKLSQVLSWVPFLFWTRTENWFLAKIYIPYTTVFKIQPRTRLSNRSNKNSNLECLTPKVENTACNNRLII